MSCPRCGGPRIVVVPYDFGMERETGYRDAGERAVCAHCGLEADVEDFREKKKKERQ